MTEIKHTFCRICEASCGLELELEQGKITDIKPNKAHIGTEGFACMKGLNQHKMYDSPDRLSTPLKRVGDDFQPISWKQAYQEIGAKVKQLRKVSEQSISMYVGTAAGFSLLHPIFAEGFMQGIGSHNIFTSATQDCANRFASATEMYGFPFYQPFVDLDNIECLLIVGTNPVVSKWTFLQVAHPVKRLKEITARGADITVVDPRLTETAKLASQHLFIKPNTDVFFFLSFLHEVFAQNAVDEEAVKKHMSGLEALREVVAPWPAEKTAEVTGVSAENLKALVTKFIKAKGAGIVTGTGIGMGTNGTLAHWLAESINAVTGNLDSKGGTLVGEGIFDFAGFAKKQGLFDRDKLSRVGGFQSLNGGFPGAILADEILQEGKDQIKALFVTGGNPLLTMANSERLKHAFNELELLVVTDIYMNETASLAHYILPSTTPLERADLPFAFPLFLGMQSKPYLAATDAVVKPFADVKDEATIYTELAKASGVSLFDSAILQKLMNLLLRVNSLLDNDSRKRKVKALPIKLLLDLVLRSSKNGSFKALAAMKDGKPWQGAQPQSFLGKRLSTDDGLVHLAPVMFLQQAQKLEADFIQQQQAINSQGFRLISKRAHSTHNSWTQNIEELTHGKMGSSNYAYLHPDDAKRLELGEDDAVDIATATGKIRLPVKFLAELMPGTVSVPHGWGHQHAKGLSVASNISGANVNILAADGPDNIERVSGMAHLTGIDVVLTKADSQVNQRSWSGI
jgi:formate dehydrogenase